MLKTLSPISLLFLLITNGISQENNIALLSRPHQDCIMLRWAPANPQTWRLGSEYGYAVKRYAVLKDKKVPKEITEVQLNQTPLKPQPIGAWEKYADDKYVAIVDVVSGDVYEKLNALAEAWVDIDENNLYQLETNYPELFKLIKSEIDKVKTIL